MQFQKNQDANAVINNFLTGMLSYMETEIKQKNDTLQFYQKIIQTNPDNTVAREQAKQIIGEIKDLIKQIIELRKDSQFMSPETQDIINSFENVCPDCGEQISLIGPHARPTLKKKKKKEFSFKDKVELWEELLGEKLKDFRSSSTFIGNVVYDPDRQEMFITMGKTVYAYCNVPERKYDGFEGAGSKGAFYNREIKGLHDC